MDINKKGDSQNSGIDKLQRDLYAREETDEVSSRQEALSSLTQRHMNAPPVLHEGIEGEHEFADVMAASAKKRNKIIIWSVFGVVLVGLFLAALFGTLWYRESRSVTEDHMEILIDAPQDFTSGQEIEYTVNYKNNSRVDWENVQLEFVPPAGFTLQDNELDLQAEGRKYVTEIGGLKAGQNGQIIITGNLIGEENTVALAEFELSITPVNFPSAVLTKSVSVSTVIAAVPLEVSIEASGRVSQGDRVFAKIKVRNMSNTVVESAYLRLAPSVGTQLAVEDEEFSSGFLSATGTWELPPIEPLGEVERIAIFYVEGQAGERRPLEVEVGVTQDENKYVQRTATHLITIATSELAVEQIYNDSKELQAVYPGQKIKGAVRYKNTGTVGLKNVIVEVQFEGEGFDPATLSLEQGAYDPRTRRITWSSATVPELATLLPQEEGELKYEFSILPINNFPTEASDSEGGFSLVSIATIDSPDLPTPRGQERRVVSSRYVMPVGTELTLQADAFYDDGRLGLGSSGPVPPEAGQETTYTLRFRLGSTLNDVGEATLVAVLPDGVRYTGEHYKTQGNVSFNERTGELTWVIPLITGLTGRTKPPQEMHAQVAIVPGEHQRGQMVRFVSSIEVSALDLFTDETVSKVVEVYPTTETAAEGQGRVQ